MEAVAEEEVAEEEVDLERVPAVELDLDLVPVRL